jgi:hypothetical protein
MASVEVETVKLSHHMRGRAVTSSPGLPYSGRIVGLTGHSSSKKGQTKPKEKRLFLKILLADESGDSY